MRRRALGFTGFYWEDALSSPVLYWESYVELVLGAGPNLGGGWRWGVDPKLITQIGLGITNDGPGGVAGTGCTGGWDQAQFLGGLKETANWPKLPQKPQIYALGAPNNPRDP